MLKNVFKVLSVFFLAGFSFFYTEKVVKVVRKNDPIMIKLNEIKNEKTIKTVKPIIKNDEYITGIFNCEIDIDESYNKMKTAGEYKEELLVMKEVNQDKVYDKYIISGNKINKNISLILIIKGDINDELFSYLNENDINVNLFVDQKFLQDNTSVIKILSEKHKIYYFGEKGKYEEKYMLFANNLIEINSNNLSKYCLIDEKNEQILNLCSNYNMSTIKTEIIKNNILYKIKEKLGNGEILTIDSDNYKEIISSINYIRFKGYKIVPLEKLFNGENNCS